MEQGSTSLSTSDGNGSGNFTSQAKHKVFLSHSGAQKGFVEQLCVDLERCDRHPFFDKRGDCLSIGKDFPSLIFEAIEQCEVGVVVLSEDFFTSKWPMLELVAMANVKKRKPSFTIMPIFLGITISQCRDVDGHKRWLSLWHAWVERDSRIVVEDWEDALQLFGPTNGLKYNFELGEVKFREEIVEAICRLVPPGTRFEDSHVQGRSRLCQVIHERIEGSKVSSYGVRVVGLYGVGGIGKTTMCKSMCNDLSTEYGDKVCHVELGSASEEEVFKEVLQKLTNKSFDRLGAMGVDKYRDHLMRDMMNVKVFLTIDNVSSATTNQALTLLRAKYGPGSVVLVTTRSLTELMALRIDASECMEMPELELEEARSLFLHRSACVPPSYLSNKDDLALIASCVERCHFKKGDGISYHYHPLALQVLGEQLGCVGYAPSRWQLFLHEIDFLNPFGEPQHPVLSILRRSFDALNPQDQLLFMDVALFAPERGYGSLLKWNLFEWLGMVHGVPVNHVIERLENLKRKSVLEDLGDKRVKIGMHDLWREFARLETKAGKFEDRCWLFEWDECNVLGEASLTWGGVFVNMRRMFFLDKGFVKLEDVNFSCFPTVTVLKLCTGFSSVHDLDLRGLKHLKSLELDSSMQRLSSKVSISIVGLGSLSKLVFLRWLNILSDSSFVNEIGCLTNLRVLELHGCGQSPDLSNLILLEVVCLHRTKLVATILGLSSKHTNLQLLSLDGCMELQSCWSVGELVALQTLNLSGCSKLKEVPNLQKLKRLQKLHVNNCDRLRALPGLGDLVSLMELHAVGCFGLAELPDMRNLVNLRILDLRDCHLIKLLPGLDELVCLQSLETSGCKNLTWLPNLYKLTNLDCLQLDPKAPLQSFMGWSNLISLQRLDVGIHELHDGLDLHKLTKLERVHIFGWQGRGILSLAKLVLLESIIVDNCKGVRMLLDLKRLSKLRILKLQRCEFEDLSDLCHSTSLVELEIMDCNKLEALPNLRELAKLRNLRIQGCALLRDFHGILGLQNINSLYVGGNPWIHENLGPNLHRLTSLRDLDLSNGGFANLQWLETYSQLWSLDCSGCPIQEFPDLANFPKLSSLYLDNCVNLMNLTCSGPLCPNLKYLNCSGCPMQELPDLANFPELSSLYLYNCVHLMNLTCSGPLCPNFKYLNISGCKRLQALPNFTNSRKMERLNVANSGVVLSAQLIQDMKARWPSIHLLTNESPSWLQSQGSFCGILRRTVGVISSLHCGCIGTSLASTHPR